MKMACRPCQPTKMGLIEYVDAVLPPCPVCSVQRLSPASLRGRARYDKFVARFNSVARSEKSLWFGPDRSGLRDPNLQIEFATTDLDLLLN